MRSEVICIMGNCFCVLCSQRGGERGRARARGGRRGHSGAGVLGAVRQLPRLPLGPQQHLLRAPRPARHAARRHDPLLVRRHRRAHPQLHWRVQLYRVHVVDVSHVVRLGPGVPPEKACLLSCGVSTGVGAAWKVAAVEPGSSVAVFGLGVVGLTVAQGCRMRGAKRIIGVDLNPEKRDIGKRLGITDFINPNDIGEKAVSEVVKEMTGGGADYCFECIGSTSVMAGAFQSSRKGWGKTVVLGVSSSGAPIGIPPHDILWGRSVVASLFGGLKPKTDIPILGLKYVDKELELDEFVTHEMGFHDINRAFDLLTQGKCLRCIIWMDGAKENGVGWRPLETDP